MVVDYRINEDEFHKISLLDCDFFIRKPPDPENERYGERESSLLLASFLKKNFSMYVTPPDTDIYSIPRVLAPMPQKVQPFNPYWLLCFGTRMLCSGADNGFCFNDVLQVEYIRCAMSDYGCYNVTEPPIDAPRDPLYKSERDISKVFLTKHYRNRRSNDPEFVLDLEEIYVIDSKSKSITRARVLFKAARSIFLPILRFRLFQVTVPGGRKRDRKDDLLVIRDNGTSFKIIHVVSFHIHNHFFRQLFCIPSTSITQLFSLFIFFQGERDDPTTVIEREEWTKTREDMEKHLRKLRDFSVSNWF
ncbi:hypothetical protein YC2023_101319 [Brassica napus]